MTPLRQLARAASQHQKTWFGEVQHRVAAGEPFALVNADAPQEILRALDVPFVVNQWWASVVAATGRAPAALQALRDRGIPDQSRQYDALALGSLLIEDPPWGGLPHPEIAAVESSGDASRKVFDALSDEMGADVFIFERTHADTVPERWWELVPHQWERAFGRDRVDLVTSECQEFIEFLEDRTGRRLHLDRLAAVMNLVNEQAELNRSTRDLIASARPTPLSLHDSINSVMIPQWHRGTPWGVNHAREFNSIVRRAVAEHVGLVPQERHRLMWIGRGLWHDMRFYSSLHETHAAVFVWSMYLGIAADGYARYGDDVLRTLASRYVGMTDQLYRPGWAAPWYAKEALSHGVNGVVHLIADDVPGSGFVTEKLEQIGIPVLEIRANNADPRSLAGDQLTGLVGEFVDARLQPLG
ncbi:MAG: 2-hydroxyacyl-CoA dehydratase [Micrococcaceae bacterium]